MIRAAAIALVAFVVGVRWRDVMEADAELRKAKEAWLRHEARVAARTAGQ